MQQTFDTGGPAKIYVELGSGSLTVDAIDGPDGGQEVVLDLSGPGADEVEVIHEGDQVSVIAPRQRGGFFTANRDVHAQLRVPADSQVISKTGAADQLTTGRLAMAKLKVGSGDIRVDEVAQLGELESGSGDVTVGFARGPLSVKCGSGDVTVAESQTSIKATTGSGDINLGRVAESAVIKAGSGDLQVAESAGTLSLTTAGGDITVRNQRTGELVLKGVAGDITVGVPEGTPVWTDISTVVGGVHSQIQGAGEPAPGADHIRIHATTVSGDITLRHA